MSSLEDVPVHTDARDLHAARSPSTTAATVIAAATAIAALLLSGPFADRADASLLPERVVADIGGPVITYYADPSDPLDPNEPPVIGY
jgi:hypothetical protein